MSFRVYSYRCEHCGFYEEERYVRYAEADEQACPECGEVLKRMPSAPRIDETSLAMGATATQAAIDKWDAKRRERIKYEERKMRDHGDRGTAPGA